MITSLRFKDLLSLLLGIGFSLFSLELIARILPATAIVGLEKPIKCENILDINLNCLHRREKNVSFRVTKGKFPFEVDA